MRRRQEVNEAKMRARHQSAWDKKVKGVVPAQVPRAKLYFQPTIKYAPAITEIQDDLSHKFVGVEPKFEAQAAEAEAARAEAKPEGVTRLYWNPAIRVKEYHKGMRGDLT